MKNSLFIYNLGDEHLTCLIIFFKGALCCDFLGLAELFPEVQSGYATVEGLRTEIRWKKGDKHGEGDRIPRMFCNIERAATSTWFIRLNGVPCVKLLHWSQLKQKFFSPVGYSSTFHKIEDDVSQCQVADRYITSEERKKIQSSTFDNRNQSNIISCVHFDV